MKKILSCALALLVLVGGCSQEEKKEEISMETGTLRTTTDGQIEGVSINEEKVLAWYGVPYAQAPIGELRWKEPQPNTAWEGVLETKEMPIGAIQKNVQSSSPITLPECTIFWSAPSGISLVC